LRVSFPPLQLETPLIDEVAICSDFAMFGQPESLCVDVEAKPDA